MSVIINKKKRHNTNRMLDEAKLKELLNENNVSLFPAFLVILIE